jgi:hypothetical protein
LDKRVLVTVDTWVNSNTEDMLVVLGENAWANNVTPWRSLALLDKNRRDNASGASLNSDGTCLIKDVLDVMSAAVFLFHFLPKIDSR